MIHKMKKNKIKAINLCHNILILFEYYYKDFNLKKPGDF